MKSSCQVCGKLKVLIPGITYLDIFCKKCESDIIDGYSSG